jgi:hypothetical protein
VAEPIRSGPVTVGRVLRLDGVSFRRWCLPASTGLGTTDADGLPQVIDLANRRRGAYLGMVGLEARSHGAGRGELRGIIAASPWNSPDGDLSAMVAPFRDDRGAGSFDDGACRQRRLVLLIATSRSATPSRAVGNWTCGGAGRVAVASGAPGAGGALTVCALGGILGGVAWAVSAGLQMPAPTFGWQRRPICPPAGRVLALPSSGPGYLLPAWRWSRQRTSGSLQARSAQHEFRRACAGRRRAGGHRLAVLMVMAACGTEPATCWRWTRI